MPSSDGGTDHPHFTNLLVEEISFFYLRHDILTAPSRLTF